MAVEKQLSGGYGKEFAAWPAEYERITILSYLFRLLLSSSFVLCPFEYAHDVLCSVNFFTVFVREDTTSFILQVRLLCSDVDTSVCCICVAAGSAMFILRGLPKWGGCFLHNRRKNMEMIAETGLYVVSFIV